MWVSVFPVLDLDACIYIYISTCVRAEGSCGLFPLGDREQSTCYADFYNSLSQEVRIPEHSRQKRFHLSISGSYTRELHTILLGTLDFGFMGRNNSNLICEVSMWEGQSKG